MPRITMVSKLRCDDKATWEWLKAILKADETAECLLVVPPWIDTSRAFVSGLNEITQEAHDETDTHADPA